ncbi:huntingtons disease protein huntingtin, putative [Pediculus humanus corporis]|uniref:Huntingtons disease protein huntingtin, putative n=1 Tax=Pediculus humanus subsp. corporis TaxID=121224 RepID=E0W1H5_PEDHC|nr:huntingtons disease protein huntingtin, putative [Pediculus humanus corporis]EEB19481.1 huntingtons disease protein huntingtin, putative [Pediculus humanus corporis]
MADKLAKAIEGLKNIQFSSSSIDDQNIGKRKKMFFCVLAADLMASPKSRNLQNLPIVIENIINLCDDKDSDVRMIADESLNRIILSLSEFHMLKIQVELHDIIRKNGSPRCLRAAIYRFGQLSQYIRPFKGNIHAQKLIPCLIEISKREEESIHETLASSFEQIFKVLGVFVQDNNLKGLIKAFLNNLSSDNQVIRRCSATCIVKLVQYCRKPQVFNTYVLNSLLDSLIPVSETNSSNLVLGVLGCIRLLLPILNLVKDNERISGSFGLKRKLEESIVSTDRLIQLYELCLHYTKNSDHNVVAASLETLNQILQNADSNFKEILLSSSGISRSYIYSMKEKKNLSRAGSEMSVTCSLPPSDDFLLDDVELSSQFFNISTKNSYGLKQSTLKSKEKSLQQDDDAKIVENPFKEKFIGTQSTLDNDSDNESSIMSELNTPPLLLFDNEAEVEDVVDEEVEDEFVQYSKNNSRENLYTPDDSENYKNNLSNIDVGNFTDAAVPLIYCTRHLAASFLLDSGPDSTMKSDKTIRVSIKSLALTCISSILKIYPVVLKMKLSKTSSAYPDKYLIDIIQYHNHCDPHIRGCVYLLIGSLINSALLESMEHSNLFNEQDSKFSLEFLTNIILKGLKDDSSIGVRQALAGVKISILTILHSPYNYVFLPILQYLPQIINNSYWLVKVKLVEVFSVLPYCIVIDLTHCKSYQMDVIDTVITLLGDEDARVRNASAEALAEIVVMMCEGKSLELEYAKSFPNDLDTVAINNLNMFKNNSIVPFSYYATTNCEKSDINSKIEHSLSVIVSKLSHLLIISENKHCSSGYIEALKILSEKYPPTGFPNGWNCSKPSTDTIENNNNLSSDLVAFVHSLVVLSPDFLDLTVLSNATILIGNLFAGVFLSGLSEEIFTHVLKVLNIYGHIIEEGRSSNVSDSFATNSSFLPLLSPVKKVDPKGPVKTEIKKNKMSNEVVKQATQYYKLGQLLNNAYSNFKVSLEKSAGDKFLNLLESTLYTLSILLEVSTIRETGRCAEEILSYLQLVIWLKPNSTLICSSQLLKSFFGKTLASCWEDKKIPFFNYSGSNFFDFLYQIPTKVLSEKIQRRANQSSLECENLSHWRRKPERRSIIKNPDEKCLATYIKLVEPMVITSFQMYKITGNVELQSHILNLLNQLMQLGLNYCILDPEQDFVSFILKQFELIERGQMPGIEILLPQIFKFLVLLSYAKQHSKPIISMPKILQLCDDLMASDQPVQTHCLPALIPVVEDVFLIRHLSEDSDLETQREVLFSKLLKLVEFPLVMDLIKSVLLESKIKDERERWKRWSRQVVDVVLPLANQNRLKLESCEGQSSFIGLMSILSLNVLRPIDPFLKVLFVEPSDNNCFISFQRWLSKVTVILETILFVKEDVFLNRLEEISPNINLNIIVPPNVENGGQDPLNIDSFFQIYEPSETAARFILKVIMMASNKISENINSSHVLQWKLSKFFLCVYHILKSGTFHRITNSLRNLLAREQDSLPAIFSPFKKFIYVCPLLTIQFSYFLTLINCCSQMYWKDVLSKPVNMSARLVQWSSVVAICDYLCDNLSDVETLHYVLVNNIEQIIILSREIPVKELLIMIAKTPDWKILIESISSNDFEISESPQFVEKLLRILELTESGHSVPLLVLIVQRYLSSSKLALSLLAGNIASRHVEFYLTLSRKEVLEKIDEKTFNELLNFFKDDKYARRHFNLWNLLKRLSKQVFESSLTDIDSNPVVEEQYIKNIDKLDEEWYFAQVKYGCTQERSQGMAMAPLINKLKYEKILNVFSLSDFNMDLLKDCLIYKRNIRLKCEDVENEDSTDSLYKASKFFLLRSIKEINDGIKKIRNVLNVDTNTPEVIEKIMSDKKLNGKIWNLLPGVNHLLEIFYNENSIIECDFSVGIFEFGILCLDILGWIIRDQESKRCRYKIYQINMKNSFLCLSLILRNLNIINNISQSYVCKKLKGSIVHIYHIVIYLISQNRFTFVINNENDLSNRDELDVLNFLTKLITCKRRKTLPDTYLSYSIRDLIIDLCRIPEFSAHVLKVPENVDMQDIEYIENFTTRFSIIGWNNKQQFEEIWVALLGVVGFNTQGDIPLEETRFIVQTSVAAVEGITTLLKSTLLDFKREKLIHHGRDFLKMKNFYDKLPLLGSGNNGKDLIAHRYYHFLDNLEISKRDDKYVFGLLSVEYLWTAVKQITSHVELYENHTKELNSKGLDLPSCVYLLTELYSQWIHQTSPDVKIIISSLKSAIVISDLFTDISQFQWLLNFCLKIDEIVSAEDTVLLPLIIFGASKAGAIVLPDNEVCESVKKLMLRSNSYPCRIATVQSLLFLLQSYVVCYAVNHKSLPPPGSNFQRDEANFVANIVDTFLPVALEVVQQFKCKTETITEDYERCHWSLIFYLLQNYQSSLGYLKDEFMTYILSTLRDKSCPDFLVTLLIRGVERLLLTTVIDDQFKDQVSKVSLEIISHRTGSISCEHGLQLMMVLSFLDKRIKDIRQLVTGQEDPERVMKDMEKINALFNKLKKSYPNEAETVGEVLSYVLMDFTASDIVTRVIQEFLSSQQPHQKILAGLLFKVFERAELNILEDWIVFSLPNLIHGMPTSMSVWILNCFFICASKDPWLRSLFPLVQSRVRMTNDEDKKLMCLLGVHFYKQVLNGSKSKRFIHSRTGKSLQNGQHL